MLERYNDNIYVHYDKLIIWNGTVTYSAVTKALTNRVTSYYGHNKGIFSVWLSVSLFIYLKNYKSDLGHTFK